MKVNDLIPMQRNVEVLVRVVKNYGIRNFKTERRKEEMRHFWQETSQE